jgi:dynein heavy chain
MRLILDKKTIKFAPDFNDYIDILINVYEIMIKMVSFVPRVETKLYSQWVSNKDILISALEAIRPAPILAP